MIAIAAAERILGQAELTPAVIDAAVREGAEYRGTEQLVADEQISDQKWERFDFGQHSNAASMFRDLRQPDAAGGAPCAYVVTKPPETVVLLWLPARFLQKGADDVNATGPVWVLVDSHPRPEHGLASAYALVFDSFSALRDTMLQRQPFISSGIEDAWMYDVCEHIGIRLNGSEAEWAFRMKQHTEKQRLLDLSSLQKLQESRDFPAGARDQIEALEKRIHTLDEERGVLSLRAVSCDESAKRLEENEVLFKKGEELRSEHRRLQQETSAMELSLANVAKQKADLEAAKQEVAELEKRSADLRGSIERVQEVVARELGVL